VSEHPILQKLGVQHPVFLSPMSGGPGTPELAAAVSNAGGLGSLGAAYLRPEEIVEWIRRTRDLTSAPFAVNLFAGGYTSDEKADTGPMLEILGVVHQTIGLSAPVLPVVPPDPFREQLQAVLEARPAAFSFTFGVPDAGLMSELRSRGIATLGTATTADEARLLMEAGVDAIVAQGSEAGGHRGTFAVPFESAMVPTLRLVQEIAAFAPVIASGGIMDGRDLATALAHGAFAAQLGTAFLPCTESGASAPYKQSLMAATTDTTVITRAFSGRPARGLPNAFTRMAAANPRAILPYPLQNALTRPLRTFAAARWLADFLSMWAGQGVARSRQMRAGQLVAKLVEEMQPGAGPTEAEKPAQNSTA
jgi:nitronate monooxygenase